MESANQTDRLQNERFYRDLCSIRGKKNSETSEMVLLLVGIVLVCALLVWLWKVPVKNLVTAMKKSGSSSFEAYTVLFLLTAGIAFAVYLIAEVI